MTSLAQECRRCRSSLERGDLRCTICGEPSDVERPQRERVEVEVLRCHGCGATVEYDARRRAPTCVFCTSAMVVETVVDPLEQTEGYLRFAVDPKGARYALRSWLGSLGFFYPKELWKFARVDDLQPIWWPGWVLTGEALVSWTADSDAGRNRARWAPHAGQNSLEFDNLLIPATRGLSSRETRDLTVSYRIESIDTERDGPDDAIVERFSTQRSMARRRIRRELNRAVFERVSRRYVPGSRQRNVHVESLLERMNTRRLSFPAYVIAYEYRGRLYRVVISGQEPRFIVGEAPLDYGKVALVVFWSLIGLVLLGWLVAG